MSVSDMGARAARDGEKQVLGHPRGLVILFFAEMWERFSYYGMRGILVLYLTWHFLFETRDAYTLYGAYAALVYLGPLVGGYLADRYLGFRKAVVFGGVLLVIGHGLMGLHGQPAKELFAAEGQTYELVRAERRDESGFRQIVVEGERLDVERIEAVDGAAPGARRVAFTRTDGAVEELEGEITAQRSSLHEMVLFLALAFIVSGVGFLKPNISTCVGALYDQDDPRRDAGFTIYYMGINTGSLLAFVTVAGTAYAYGWGPAFGLAAFGMAIGLAVFLWGQSWLEGRAEPPDPAMLTQPVGGLLTREHLVYIGGLAMVGVAFLLLQSAALLNESLKYAFVAVSGLLVAYTLSKLDAVERDRMIALIILTVASVLFWTLFEQAPTSLTVFATEFVADTFFGLPVNAGQLQAWNPAFILVFAVPVTLLWTFLGRRRAEPSSAVKFAGALMLVGAGFWVLNIAIAQSGVDEAGAPVRIAIGWVALMYMLHTLGELMLSPVGLSAVTKLSVPRLVSFMMGFWFFAISAAQALGAQVARLTVSPEGASQAEALAHFGQVYFWLGGSSVALGVVLLVASPFVRHLTHGRG